jgi:hypothetical protein
MQQDEGAFRSWCSSCAALCDAVYQQLSVFEKLTQQRKHRILVRRKEHAQVAASPAQALSLPGRQSDPQQRSREEHQQEHQQHPLSAHPDRVDDAVQIWLDRQVIALLPVVGAATLQLAHSALTCVRLMKTKVVKGR